jgi:Tfp pilus assembly protein PilN
MELRLNLASRFYLDRRSVRRWLLLLGTLLALWLAVDLLYGYRYLQQWWQAGRYLEEIDSRLVQERGVEVSSYTPEQFARVKEQIGIANQIIAADQFRWTALLSRFEALLPDSVAIRSLKPDYAKRTLQLSLVARDTAAMTELLDTLLNSEDMAQVFLSSQAQSGQAEGDSVVQFSLTIQEAF